MQLKHYKKWWLWHRQVKFSLLFTRRNIGGPFVDFKRNLTYEKIIQREFWKLLRFIAVNSHSKKYLRWFLRKFYGDWILSLTNFDKLNFQEKSSPEKIYYNFYFKKKLIINQIFKTVIKTLNFFWPIFVFNWTTIKNLFCNYSTTKNFPRKFSNHNTKKKFNYILKN